MHTHGAASSQAHPTPDHERRLTLALGLTCTIMVAELIGGLLASSLSLVADAGHMLVDLLALGTALASLRLGRRPADARRTFGYRRLEVLAALVNCLLLLGLCGGIVVEALQRLRHPSPVAADTMLLVAGVGLVANLVGLRLLGHATHNLSVRGAFLHLLGDTLSSLGAIVAALCIRFTGYTQIDPILSIAISAIIVVSSLRLLRDAAEVLLEAVPRHLCTEAVQAALLELEGVGGLHDLHIWSISAELAAVSAHLVLKRPGDDPFVVLQAARAVLLTRFHLEHATLQVEAQPSSCACSVAQSHPQR